MTRSFTILFALMLVFSALCTTAQVKNVQEEAERQGTKRVNRKIDKGIDKGFDKIEEGIGSLFGKKKKKNKEDDDNASSEDQSQNTETTNANASASPATAPTMDVQWSRFDFVPGDEVIFEDGPDIMEENGEFPSRWDLVSGNCEIIQVNGENVIAFPKGGSIVPYLKNSKTDYLPEVFTIEFDAWLWHDNQRDIYVNWYDKKNQKNSLHDDLEINSFSLEASNTYQELERKTKHNGKWRHISIAYTKGKLKAYLDETRLINIPHYEGNPSGVTITCSGYSSDTPEQLQYIKNVRIAKGGVKYYDRVLSDGKIVCNGIRFDVNKATMKPESMGPINEIFSLMQKQPDLKFSVEGHTDSDGDDANNQTLSEQRAQTVMTKLIAMGISADRLTSKGFGESQPVADNGTVEGKANNRRVEFVKF